MGQMMIQLGSNYIQLMFECENHVSMGMFTNHYYQPLYSGDIYWDPC